MVACASDPDRRARAAMLLQILQIVQIVAPVFLLAAGGFVWQRRGYVFDLEFVTLMSMQVATPCLVFSVLSTLEIDPVAFQRIALAALVGYLAVAAAAFGFIRLAQLNMRAFLAPTIFGNTGNIGLPIALFAFGEIGLGYAMVVFAVMVLLNFTVGLWLVSGDPTPKAALQQPIVYASILGSIFALSGWSLPAWAANTLDLTGQMAIPMLLITLGVSIAKLSISDARMMTIVSVAKLLICAVCGAGAAWIFDLGPIASGALILQLITPVAVTSYMLAARYNAEPDRIAGLVVVSTMLSLIAIPAALTILL